MKCLSMSLFGVTVGTVSLLSADTSRQSIALTNEYVTLPAETIDGPLVNLSGNVDLSADNAHIFYGGSNALSQATIRSQTSVELLAPAGTTGSYFFKDSDLSIQPWIFSVDGPGDISTTLENTRLRMGTYSIGTSKPTLAIAPTDGTVANVTLKGPRTRVSTPVPSSGYAFDGITFGRNDDTLDGGATILNILDGASLNPHYLYSYGAGDVFAVTNGFIGCRGSFDFYRGRLLFGGESMISAPTLNIGWSATRPVDFDLGGQSCFSSWNAQKFARTGGGVIKIGLSGGTVIAPSVYGYGKQTVTSDGGKVEPIFTGVAYTSTTGFLYNFGSFALGTAGLTVSSAGYDIPLLQDFDELPSSVGASRLILEGAGVKTLYAGIAGTHKGESMESYLDVKGGKTVLASGVHENATLSVAENACFSLAGTATAATFAGLNLGTADTAGVLEFDSGDMITIDGEASVGKAAIRPTFALTAGTTYSVFRAKTVAAGAAAEWAKAKVVSGTSPNFTYRFTTADVDGYTVFSVTPTDTGSLAAQSVAWTDDATLDVASVTQNSGTKIVSGDYVAVADTSTFNVAKDAEVRFEGKTALRRVIKQGEGSLVFNGMKSRFADGLQIEGGLVYFDDFPSIAAFRGGEALVMKSGTLAISNVVDEAFFPYLVRPEPADKSTAVAIRADSNVRTWAPLTYLSGDKGCFLKRGAGRLTVYPRNIALDKFGGALPGTSATPPSRDVPQVLDDSGAIPSWHGGWTVAEGELSIRHPGARYAFDGDGLVLGIPAKNVKRQPGLVLDGVQLTTGMPYLGAYLTEENSDASCWSPYLILTNGAVMCGSLRFGGWQLARTGFNSTSTAPITPRLEVDGSELYINEAFGFKLNSAASSGSKAKVVFKNGSRVRMCAGGYVQMSSSVDLVVDNSEFVGADYVSAGGVKDRNECGVTGFMNGYERNILSLTWENAVAGAQLAAVFRNNARMRIRNIGPGSNLMRLTFDGATWVLNGVDSNGYAGFRANSTALDKMELVSTGRGLTLEIDDPEFSFHQPITGVGGLIKTGVGTLRIARAEFGTGTYGRQPSWQFRGALEVRAGGVVIGDTQCMTNTAFVAKVSDGAFLDLGGRTFGGSFSGCGTLKNGVLTNAVIATALSSNGVSGVLMLASDLSVENPTFAYTLDNDWNPAGTVEFGGAAPIGKVVLDFGRQAGNPPTGAMPSEITVGSYVGAAPDVRKWTLVGTGLDRKLGRIKCEDGRIFVDTTVRGLLILVH